MALTAPTTVDVRSAVGSSIEVSWSNDAADEDGLRVMESTDGGATFSEVAEVGPGVTVATFPRAVNVDYVYKVRAFSGATTDDSSTTAQRNFLKRRSTRGSKWYVEVDAPPADDAPGAAWGGFRYGETTYGDPEPGNVHRPTVLDGVQRIPGVNGLPQVRVPVPRDDKWTSSDFERATMRVWFDGNRQPIDELHAVETREDKTILHGRGGTDLLTTVQQEYDVQAVHTAASNLVSNETTLTANVDAPTGTEVSTNTQVQSADTDSELTNNLVTSIAATDPLEISGGKLKVQQTLFFFEGESPDSGSSTTFNDSDYSNGQGAVFTSSTDDVTFNFTPQYTIPKENIAIEARTRNRGGNSPANVDVILDGENLGFVNHSHGDTTTLDWIEAGPDSTGVSQPSGDLAAGQQTSLRLNCQADGDDWDWDAIAIYDSRYSYNFVNTLTSGFLDGPELYPDAVQRQFVDHVPVYSISGGKATVTIDDSAGSEQLALSNDQGASFATKANVTTFEHDFASLGPALRFRIQLSRYGSRTTQAPTSGFNGQQLDKYTLSADYDDTPLVVNRSFDTTVLDILQELASLADDVFTVERDPTGASVEWTQPGARSSDADLDVVTYESEKTTAEVHEKVTVYGSAQRRRGEAWTANTGAFVDLEQDNLQPGREVVYDPSTGTQYSPNTDYEMDHRSGRVKALSAGTITDGASLEISYDYQPSATHTAQGVTTPVQPITRTIPSLTTDRACGQAALQIVQEVKNPLYKTRVIIPGDAVEWSVVEDLDLTEIPTNGNRLSVEDVEAAPEQTVVLFDSRETVGDVVGDIDRRVGAVSERV